MSLLTVNDLTTYFYTRRGIVRAVDGVSFHVEKGETLGIVGESGCGKSVACYSLLGLIPQPPGKIVKGNALFENMDLLHCSKAQLRKIRGKRISIIFQDPMSSLNPYLKISEQLMEPLLLHTGCSRKKALFKAIEALEEVGIQDAPERIFSYPHEFSGGMRQRVMIAMALITHPDILIADEPTTALDVTVQAQILDIIDKRRKELGTSVIFITHDLGIVAGFCDRVHVMYAGKILEGASTDQLFYQSQHPYTQALQKSIPALHRKDAELYTIPGMPPNLSGDIRGCPFAPRCEFAKPYCYEPIILQETTNKHLTACTRYQRGELK
jgi:oligopeptide transport system ATP-binding protein